MKGYKVAKREFNRICKDLESLEKHRDFFWKGCLAGWHEMQNRYLRKEQIENTFFDMRAFEYDEGEADGYFKMCCKALKEGYKDTDRRFEIDIPYGFTRKNGRKDDGRDVWVAAVYPFFFHNCRTHENALGYYPEVKVVHAKDDRPVAVYGFRSKRMASKLFKAARKYIDWAYINYAMYDRYMAYEIDPEDCHLADPLSYRRIIDSAIYHADVLSRNIDWNFGRDASWNSGSYDKAHIISKMENGDDSVTMNDLLCPDVRFDDVLFKCVNVPEPGRCRIAGYTMYERVIAPDRKSYDWIPVYDFENDDDLLDYLIMRYPEKLNDELKVRQAERWARAIEAYESVMNTEEADTSDMEE